MSAVDICDVLMQKWVDVSVHSRELVECVCMACASDDVCAICLVSLRERATEVVRLPCGHLFCAWCCGKWEMSGGGRGGGCVGGGCAGGGGGAGGSGCALCRRRVMGERF